MVPSRSRKTAGRRDVTSARSHLRGTKPATRCRLDSLWLDAGHATVVDRAAPQKTRTAVRLFLYDGASGSNRGGAVRIGRTENCHDRQSNCGGNVHRSRIVADEKLAARKQCREIGNRRFANQSNHRAEYSSRDSVRYLLLRCRTEKNHIRICTPPVTVYEISEALRRPTLCGAIGCARSDGDARDVTARPRGRQNFFRALPQPFCNFELHRMFVRQCVDPAGAPQQFQIIKLFVRLYFAALWHPNSLG